MWSPKGSPEGTESVFPGLFTLGRNTQVSPLSLVGEDERSSFRYVVGVVEERDSNPLRDYSGDL